MLDTQIEQLKTRMDDIRVQLSLYEEQRQACDTLVQEHEPPGLQQGVQLLVAHMLADKVPSKGAGSAIEEQVSIAAFKLLLRLSPGSHTDLAVHEVKQVGTAAAITDLLTVSKQLHGSLMFEWAMGVERVLVQVRERATKKKC
jgi:hypothetical protein